MVQDAHSATRGLHVGDDVMAKARVVVVDDSAANVALLERLLRTASISDVHGITDSREALTRIAELEPDLVLLDLHMPHVDGFELLRGLRSARSAGEFLPVLVLTADVTGASKERALSAGAKDFLTKPFERAEVVLRVRNLLETRGLYQRLQQHNVELQAAVDQHAAGEREAAEDRDRSIERIERALRPGALTMVFQPIVDLATATVVGVEALARFSCEPRRPPDEWFAEAADVGRSLDFEIAAVSAAVRRLDQLPPTAFLSLNVSPETAMTAELDAVLSAVPAERVIVELTEHRRVDDYERLLGALGTLRTRGVRVAVDDAGAGYAGLQHILKLSPDILKLDTALTRDIDTDLIRRALAASLVTFALETNAVIVAEGIETVGELQALRGLGVPWGQGYHLAHPGPLPLASNRLDALASPAPSRSGTVQGRHSRCA
jgi:EAL domain-containing protein (putative c-di-GMP-specific phosphodiesterase class I)/DNA-binding response OmpR family regulator